MSVTLILGPLVAWGSQLCIRILPLHATSCILFCYGQFLLPRTSCADIFSISVRMKWTWTFQCNNNPISLFLLYTVEYAISKGNNCLDAAKACNLNDTCKKLRSAYITPCTSSVSNEICNKRKCHKALRQFFDKVPPKHSYGMLFCSCQNIACTERRRQTIVPVCSYEDKEKPNCLNLQDTCKTNYICR